LILPSLRFNASLIRKYSHLIHKKNIFEGEGELTTTCLKTHTADGASEASVHLLRSEIQMTCTLDLRNFYSYFKQQLFHITDIESKRSLGELVLPRHRHHWNLQCWTDYNIWVRPTPQSKKPLIIGDG